MKNLVSLLVIIVSFSTYSQTFNIEEVMKMDYSQLYDTYGKDNIKKEIDRDYEDNPIGYAARIYANSNDELRISFGEDKSYTNISGITLKKKNSRWILPYGLKVGNKLSEVIEINGKDFSFYAFEGDLHGLCNNWNGGKLDSYNLIVHFTPNPNINVNMFDEKYRGIYGNGSVESSNEALETLDIEVFRIEFSK